MATAAPEETSTPSTGSGPVGSLVNAVTSALPGGGTGTGTGTLSPPSTGPGPVGSFVNAVTSALPGGGTGTGTGTLSPPSSGLVGSNNPLRSVTQRAAAALPKPFTPPAPQAVPQVVDQGSNPETTPDNSGQGSRNIIRDSLKFTPESSDSRILFGSGGPGVDNGIRGWGEGLDRVKSALGIKGPDDSGSGE